MHLYTTQITRFVGSVSAPPYVLYSHLIDVLSRVLYRYASNSAEHRHRVAKSLSIRIFIFSRRNIIGRDKQKDRIFKRDPYSQITHAILLACARIRLGFISKEVIRCIEPPGTGLFVLGILKHNNVQSPLKKYPEKFLSILNLVWTTSEREIYLVQVNKAAMLESLLLKVSARPV